MAGCPGPSRSLWKRKMNRLWTLPSRGLWAPVEPGRLSYRANWADSFRCSESQIRDWGRQVAQAPFWLAVWKGSLEEEASEPVLENHEALDKEGKDIPLERPGDPRSTGAALSGRKETLFWAGDKKRGMGKPAGLRLRAFPARAEETQ